MASNRDLMISAAAFIIMHHLIKKKEKAKRKRRCRESQTLKRSAQQLLREIPASDLLTHFSMVSSQDFDFLVSTIRPKICKNDKNIRESVPGNLKIAITLRYLAIGESYASLMSEFGVSKQSIATLIPDVCAAIVEILDGYIKLPHTRKEWINISGDFEKRWHFPHCVGAIDEKLIVSGSEHSNPKSFDNIVLFAMVDANYNFLFVDVTHQDKTSKGKAQMPKKLKKALFNLPTPKLLPGHETPIPYVTVGDKAFVLNDILMKPYSGINQEGSKERNYNHRLGVAHRTVENAFGILSSAFRVLKKPLFLTNSKSQLVVLACVYLHNFLFKSETSRDLYCPQSNLDTEVIDMGSNIGVPSQCNIRLVPNISLTSPEAIRKAFSEYFFVNGTEPGFN